METPLEWEIFASLRRCLSGHRTVENNNNNNDSNNNNDDSDTNDTINNIVLFSHRSV